MCRMGETGPRRGKGHMEISTQKYQQKWLLFSFCFSMTTELACTGVRLAPGPNGKRRMCELQGRAGSHPWRSFWNFLPQSHIKLCQSELQNFVYRILCQLAKGNMLPCFLLCDSPEIRDNGRGILEIHSMESLLTIPDTFQAL